MQAALTDARTPTAHTHPASDITGLNLSQITSPDGDTTVKANNNGTVTITAPTTGYGDAIVSFPDGFSVGYGDETYTAPSGGETIRLVGPYEVGSYTFYVPSTVQNPESFDPSQQSVWCVYFTSGGAALMFGTGPFYTVSNWDTASPSLTLNTGTASGGTPSMTRAGATATKTVATVDQIPAPVDISKKADDEAIAPAFSANETYAVGDYCVHACRLYRCTNATSGSWDASDWTEVDVMGEMPAPITVDSAMSSSSTNPVQNKVVYARIKLYVPWSRDNYGAGYTALSIGARQMPPVGSVEADTGVNSVTIGECRAFGACSFSQGGANVAAGLYSHVEGQAGYAAGQSSHCEGRGCSAAGLASHAAGRRAICAASGTAASPTTPHDYAFAWQGDTTSGGGANLYYSHGEGTFNINPVPASGSTDPATGFWIGETKLSDYIRYAFSSPAPSVSGTSATVACEDRAINDFTVATGITSLTITPPAAVTGRARDFFCRVTLTDSSLPTVTLSGATIDIGASEVAGMTQGVNLLMFTEIASGHWLASRRSAS